MVVHNLRSGIVTSFSSFSELKFSFAADDRQVSVLLSRVIADFPASSLWSRYILCFARRAIELKGVVFDRRGQKIRT